MIPPNNRKCKYVFCLPNKIQYKAKQSLKRHYKKDQIPTESKFSMPVFRMYEHSAICTFHNIAPTNFYVSLHKNLYNSHQPIVCFVTNILLHHEQLLISVGKEILNGCADE